MTGRAAATQTHQAGVLHLLLSVREGGQGDRTALARPDNLRRGRHLHADGVFEPQPVPEQIGGMRPELLFWK